MSSIDPSQILKVLDDACEAFEFPMLDNGYVYLAATRMSLYRSPSDWALVFEIFGYSPRAGFPDLLVKTFASRLPDRDKAGDFATPEAHQNYLINHPHDESRYFYPIAEGAWMDEEDPESIADAGFVQLREGVLSLPPLSDYGRHGIDVEGDRPTVSDFCRFAAAEWRDQVLATLAEQRVSVLPDMEKILQLDEWHHPDLADGELASESETFRQLAQVIDANDVSYYRPTQAPNTHWSYWPEGGLL